MKYIKTPQPTKSLTPYSKQSGYGFFSPYSPLCVEDPPIIDGIFLLIDESTGAYLLVSGNNGLLITE